MEKDLQKAFEALRGKYNNVCLLHQDYEDQNTAIKQLLLELLNSVDKTILERANESIENFKEAINKSIAKFGSSWADIIINFNWHDELS